MSVIGVTRYRHNAPSVADLPGLAQGTDQVWSGLAEVAARYFAEGTRRVVVEPLVDLAGGLGDPATARTLAFVRELTAYAIVVDWTLRLGEHAGIWARLSHLYPPSTVLDGGSAEILREWRSRHFIGRCVYRRGPGFVQVRDRRQRNLSRVFTIDVPEYLDGLDRLLDGTDPAGVPAHVLEDFVGAELVQPLGDAVLWLPYRVRRWPVPAMTI